jgi:hypothetical protein
MKVEPKSRPEGDDAVLVLLMMAREKALNGSPLGLRTKKRPKESLGDKLVRLTRWIEGDE